MRTNNDEEGQGEHLSKLAVLDHLTQWSISSANFYEHQIFNLLEVRGDQLVHLELVEVDEVNLNAILLLGSHCINLQNSMISFDYSGFLAKNLSNFVSLP